MGAVACAAPEFLASYVPRSDWHSMRCEVGRRHILLEIAHVSATEERGLVFKCVAGRCHRRHIAEVLAGQIDHLIVVNATRGGQHHPRSGVVRLDVSGDIIRRDGVDVLHRAQDRARERRAHIGDLVQPIEHDLHKSSKGRLTGEAHG
eukprot:scaffold197086_cov36-Tisochrysis_lutea.AAC.2